MAMSLMMMQENSDNFSEVVLVITTLMKMTQGYGKHKEKQKLR